MYKVKRRCFIYKSARSCMYLLHHLFNSIFPFIDIIEEPLTCDVDRCSSSKYDDDDDLAPVG